MKRGFTLVEMLIVVVVLVTLMSIAFRLAATGDDQERRNKTISRLQRVENCLSGYYAAFGTYPPVRLHGSHQFELEVNKYGIQKDSGGMKLDLSWYKDAGNHGIGTSAEERDWKQVKAVCAAQPVAARFPFPEGYNEVIKARIAMHRAKNAGFTGYDDGYTDNIGRHNFGESEWRYAQQFQFGLMSYLLPRYIVMMNFGPWEKAKQFMNGAQWRGSNSEPCNPLSYGERMTWQNVWDDVRKARKDEAQPMARIMNIPSQAACARWMPNLERCCNAPHVPESLFGINIRTTDDDLHDLAGPFTGEDPDNDAGGSLFQLDWVTVTDGWYYELYYYSPPPYQSYILWSAGPNHRTFPPWVSRASYSESENKCIGAWIEDDIIHMSN